MSTPSIPELEVEQDGAICTIYLNRPEALNAANAALHSRLATIWLDLANRPDCRAIVVSGRGRGFCAGADIDLLAQMHDDDSLRDAVMAEAALIVQNMIRFPLPAVAAVNGPAVGLGCSLAALCDVVVIEESAYFADPHVAIGLVASDGGALVWPALTSILQAKEYLFTGDRIDAETAVRLGLANHVVPDGTSIEHAMRLAQRFAVQPPRAIQATKRAVNKYLERAMVEILDFALAAETVTFSSTEHRQIVAEMLARRSRKAAGSSAPPGPRRSV